MSVLSSQNGNYSCEVLELMVESYSTMIKIWKFRIQTRREKSGKSVIK